MGASAKSPLSGRTYYKVAGSTGFAELQLRIFDKGALLIGYHISSLKLKSASGSESDPISNVMLGFQLPLGGGRVKARLSSTVPHPFDE